MDVIICGGGDIGGSAAQVLAGAGDAVTIIESDDDRAQELQEHLDVAIVHGSGSTADTLRAAGVAHADAVIATTATDEVNLVISAVADALGAARTMARVDHSGLLRDGSLDYANMFCAGRLFSPDRALARSMAARLRNPEAKAIEHFGGGIELQQFEVDEAASACGSRLRDITLPEGTRLAALTREGRTRLPTADTRLLAGDLVLLAAQQEVMQEAHDMLGRGTFGRRNIAIYGSGPAAIWLCRMLGSAAFNIRLFEPDRDRAQELGEQLEQITVLCSDPARPEVFDDEHLERVDAFISTGTDEQNLLACGYAARMGIAQVMPVLRRGEFAPLLERLGVPESFNPRTAAVREITRFLRATTFDRMQEFTGGALLLVRGTLGANSPLAGSILRDVAIHPPVIIAAAERSDGTAFVPGPDTVLDVGRRVMAIADPQDEQHVRRLLDIGAAG
ncbi:MAG: Trk system potassium transporter TrkA [Phycisphaerales bacterium]|nr:Trk system potassium transporter TrkA [Phycisphaerales bacterium]